MAGTLRSLNMILRADTGKFDRSLKKSSKTVQLLSKGVKGLSSVISKMAKVGGIATAGLAAGFGLLVKSQMKAIDATAKLADVLGLTTKELSGYGLAAELSGVSTEQLGTALKRMLKNISDAELGLTTAKRAFATLGLDSAALKAMDTGEAFGAILDGLKGISRPADRARVALDLFGRSGLGLIKLADGGAAGLKEITREAEALGIVFSRLDAKKVEQANDAITRMKAAFKGIAIQFSIKIAPIITEVVGKFVEWAKATDFAKTGSEGLFNGLKSIAVLVAQMIDATRISINRVLATIFRGIEKIESVLDRLPGSGGGRGDSVGFGPGFGRKSFKKTKLSADFDAAADSILASGGLSGPLAKLLSGITVGGKSTAPKSSSAIPVDAKSRAIELAKAKATGLAIFERMREKGTESLKLFGIVGTKIAKAVTDTVAGKGAPGAKAGGDGRLAGAASFGSSAALSAINRAAFKGGGAKEMLMIAKKDSKTHTAVKALMAGIAADLDKPALSF